MQLSLSKSTACSSSIKVLTLLRSTYSTLINLYLWILFWNIFRLCGKSFCMFNNLICYSSHIFSLSCIEYTAFHHLRYSIGATAWPAVPEPAKNQSTSEFWNSLCYLEIRFIVRLSNIPFTNTLSNFFTSSFIFGQVWPIK